MSERVRLGISTCPNDTFAFHGLMHRLVDWRGLEFEIDLVDIQVLNDRLFRGDFDVAKTSFHAALLLAAETIVMPVGSALGFGVGPLLLAAEPGSGPAGESQLTLCPGTHTTAALLFDLFHPDTTRVQHCVFSEIMPRLVRRQADFGVCIHEGRFTYQQSGLFMVEDLGARWEELSGGPLPLGGLIARRGLSPDTLERVYRVIRDSLALSRAEPSAALPTMRQHAQEFADEVLMQHVDLYVNHWTVDLGETGARALSALSEMAQSRRLVAAGSALEVWKPGNPV